LRLSYGSGANAVKTTSNKPGAPSEGRQGDPSLA
jgi:hypothetical protein